MCNRLNGSAFSIGASPRSTCESPSESTFVTEFDTNGPSLSHRIMLEQSLAFEP
jgi:hypothetical protein